MSDIIISLQNISAEYDGEKVIDKLNLDIRDHEFVTFLGPSGCGKTTTLRIIGGFIEPTEGDVFFEGEKINGLPPFKRNVNTVFQRYALFPHLDVYGNIAFGLKQKKVLELNPGLDPNRLYAGRKIKLPGKIDLKSDEAKSAPTGPS